MEARLYAVPASHPSLAVGLMLEQKGIAHKRTDLFPAVSRVILRALGFPGKTVPALKIDGRKLVGSREISRALDEIRPDPPLFPADPEKRTAVEEAERFGEEELQHPIRQISWWAIKRDRSSLRSYSEGAKLGIPIGLAVRTAAPIIALEVRINDADDANVRRDLAALPGLLDRVDALIEAGVLGGEQLNAADFQIATSLGLAMTLQDLRPAIEGRPAGRLAKRVVPSYPGDAPPILPPAWLTALRDTTSAGLP
jgi:glutathione S-transferase